MKCRTLLKLSTLIVAVACTNATIPSTFAEGTFDGRRFWTAEDFLSYEAEAENDRFLSCGEDIECRRDYFVNRIENDDTDRQYARLDVFNTSPIVLSGINPSEETIDIMFRGQEEWSKMDGYLQSEPNQLNELYLVWLDESVPDPTEDQSWFDPSTEHYHPYYVDEIISGYLEPGTHLVFNSSVDSNLTQSDVITNVQMAPGNQIAENARNKIFYSYNISGISSSGAFDYDSCVNHPYYREGMTCKFVIDEYFNQSFIPFTADGLPATAEVTANTPKDPALEQAYGQAGGSPTEVNDGTISGEPIATQDTAAGTDIATFDTVASTNTTTPNAVSAIDTAAAQNTATISNSASMIKAPETGAVTSEEVGDCRKVAFPWWLLALFAIGNVVLVWFFMPNRKRK